MKNTITIILFILLAVSMMAQQKLDFDGQLSLVSSYSPQNDLDVFIGGRYIPQLSYKIPLDSIRFVDFEASANVFASSLFHPFDTSENRLGILPYRGWFRYSDKQFELRVGLQKIDFGSSTLLRPIQWFNQIDPRDPLQLTNGVYAVLGRYYFLNNANIWLWALYGNEKTRGFDVLESNWRIPEIGTRVQYPVPKGELALSYHYRTANSLQHIFLPPYEKIPEHRIGIDGKWDLKVGLWTEAAYVRSSKKIGDLTNQTFINIGADYTFGVGSGLNIIAEHLILSYDEEAFAFRNTANLTAMTLAYPFTMYDRLSTIFYYNWSSKDVTFFLNYEHQFKRITTYVMLYHNPNTMQGIQQNDLVNNFSGAGLRVAVVFNH